MALITASLNSGSNGNCYYIGNNMHAVLIDAGLTLKETEKRMQQLGLSFKKVWGIFISHEHTDHIKGASTIANKYNIPLYATAKTLATGQIRLVKHLAKHFNTNDTIQVGSLQVKAFSKYHDAVDPHSFTVSDTETTIGVFTDIGRVCDNVISHFKQCHAVYLESNYDDTMLANGRYPWILKERIRNGYGHLSNHEAFTLLEAHRPAHMTHIWLAHLSKENNSPELALTTFASLATNMHISVASRDLVSPMYEIGSPQKGFIEKKTSQLTLF